MLKTINIIGPLGFTSGLGTSFIEIEKELIAAATDPKIKAICLFVNSPGGQVLGIKSVVHAIKEAKKRKPVFSLVMQACSAAYWIVAASTKIYLKDETAVLGSIGVIMSHFDLSKQLEQEGVKITEITSAPGKVLESPNFPLSEDGKKYLQETVDYYSKLFTNDVKKFRLLKKDTLEEVLTGKVFTAEKALKLNLADAYFKGSYDMDLEEKIKELEKENKELREELEANKKSKAKAEEEEQKTDEEKQKTDENTQNTQKAKAKKIKAEKKEENQDHKESEQEDVEERVSAELTRREEIRALACGDCEEAEKAIKNKISVEAFAYHMVKKNQGNSKYLYRAEQPIVPVSQTFGNFGVSTDKSKIADATKMIVGN